MGRGDPGLAPSGRAWAPAQPRLSAAKVMLWACFRNAFLAHCSLCEVALHIRSWLQNVLFRCWAEAPAWLGRLAPRPSPTWRLRDGCRAAMVPTPRLAMASTPGELDSDVPFTHERRCSFPALRRGPPSLPSALLPSPVAPSAPAVSRLSAALPGLSAESCLRLPARPAPLPSPFSVRVYLTLPPAGPETGCRS